MSWFGRPTVFVLLVMCVIGLVACTTTNEVPAVAAAIEAFSGTPQVIVRGERVELRWRAEGALSFQLLEHVGSTMPDDDQAWSCLRLNSEMVCTAPAIPSSGNGWSCDGTDCRRPVAEDPEGYRPVVVSPTAIPTGGHSVFPDQTSTYRVEAQGNTGVAATAWVQVVVAPEVQARILSWTAWPSPAIEGEAVTLSYQAEGCDSVDTPAASPELERDELVGDEDNDNRSGFFIWRGVEDEEGNFLGASITRDFYFACHPEVEESNEDARIRSHITVNVLRMPTDCPRIEIFEAVPSGNVEPGTEISVRWVTRNVWRLTGEAVPEPSRQFYISGFMYESGTWTGRINEDTSFTLTAQADPESDCRPTTASLVVTVAEDCTPDCEGHECGDDGCGGSCGSCEEGYYCDPEDFLCHR